MKQINFAFLIIILFQFIISENGNKNTSIILKLTKDENNIWTTPFTIGPDNKDNLIENISFNLQRTQFYKNIDLKYVDKVHSKYEDMLDGTEVLFSRVSLTLKILSDNKNYPITIKATIHDAEDNYFPNGLPLALHFDNKDYSILDQLVKNKFIIYPSFGFSFDDYKKEGIFFFGDLPNELVKEMKSKSCSALNGLNWGCELNKVEIKLNKNIKDTEDFSNGYSLFQTDSPEILAPKNFLNFLYINSMKKLFEEGVCKYYEYTKSYFLCQENDKLKELEINFVFNEMNIAMNYSELFTKIEDVDDEKYCLKFKIIGSFSKNWIFGTSFYNKKVIFFDANKNTITFFEHDIKFNHNEENYSNFSWIKFYLKFNKTQKILFIVLNVFYFGLLIVGLITNIKTLNLIKDKE